MILVVGVLLSTSVLGSESRPELRALFAEYGREARSLHRDEFAVYVQNDVDHAAAMEAGESGSAWLLQSRMSETMMGQNKAFMDRRLELMEQAKQLIRQSSDDDLIDLLLSAEALPAALFLSNTMMPGIAESQQRHPEFQRLRDLFHASRPLQQRVIDLWWNERPYVSFLFSVQELNEHTERLQSSRDEFLSPPLGAIMVGVAFNAVPKSSLLTALDEAVAARTIRPLPEHIEELIENGVLAMFLELPAEALAERVERGELIWLKSLVERDPEGHFAIANEHVDRLSLEQQLHIVQSRPNAESIEILRAAWYQAMDDLSCQGCMPPAEAVDQMELVNALVAMPGQEVADMLVELVELQKAIGEDRERAGVIFTMFFSSNEAVVSSGLELARHDELVSLPLFGLKRLHAANPDAFQALVVRKLERFQAMAEVDRDELLAGPMACQFSALSLYAKLAGMASPWPSWFEQHRASMPDPRGCASAFTEVLSIETMTAAGLDLVLDAYLGSDSPVDPTAMLVANFRNRRMDDHGLLAERLSDTPVWDALDQDDRDWLLGVQTSEKSGLSCEGEVALRI